MIIRGYELRNYLVGKKVEAVEISTFTHEVVEKSKKKNVGNVVVLACSKILLN